MKTIHEILQETVRIARELGQLDKEEEKLKNTPVSIPEVKGEGEVAELQVRLASIKAEREWDNKFRQLRYQIEKRSETLNTILWLFEDNKIGKS